jgi:hypothetical protein
MATSDIDNAVTEHKQHRYVGHRIPWYVHLIWISFWTFAVIYTLRYLFPDIQKEFRKAQTPASAQKQN